MPATGQPRAGKHRGAFTRALSTTHGHTGAAAAIAGIWAEAAAAPHASAPCRCPRGGRSGARSRSARRRARGTASPEWRSRPGARTCGRKRQSPRPTVRQTVGTAQSRPRGWGHSQKDGKGLLRCTAKGAAGGTLHSGSASHVDEGPPPSRVCRKVLRRGRVHMLPDPGPLTQPRLPQRFASIRQRRGGAMRAIYAVPAWIALAARLKRGWGEGEEQVIPPAQPEIGPRCSAGRATRPGAQQCPCCSAAHQYPALHSPRALHWLKQNCGQAGAGRPHRPWLGGGLPTLLRFPAARPQGGPQARDGPTAEHPGSAVCFAFPSWLPSHPPATHHFIGILAGGPAIPCTARPEQRLGQQPTPTGTTRPRRTLTAQLPWGSGPAAGLKSCSIRSLAAIAAAGTIAGVTGRAGSACGGVSHLG